MACHHRRSGARLSREDGTPLPQPSAKFPSSVFDSFLQSNSFTRQERVEESVRSADYWDVNEEFDLKKAVEFYISRKASETVGNADAISISSRVASHSTTIHGVKSSTSTSSALMSQADGLLTSKAPAAGPQSPNFNINQYKRHAWGNGMLLHFKKKSIDKAFMNETSVLHKKTLLVGYVIEVALAIILVVLDNLFFMYETYICRAGDSGKDRGFYCDTLFGPQISDRRNEFNLSYFISLLILNIAGGLAHVYIHKSEKVKNKSWALLSASLIYLTEIVLLILLMVFLHSGDNFWPLKLMMWYMLLMMGSIWLTGFLFVQNLVVFVIGITTYFAATFDVATSTVNLNSENELVSELDRLLTTSLYTSTAHFVIFIHIAMLASSYMHERASRKRFFQRLMITYQQDKIISSKVKHGKLQKELLFNMLPPRVVNQLEEQGYDTGSWEQLKVVSARHQGVSILFADIPNFQEFASAAEPSYIMEYLNEVFESFDNLCDLYDVYKVETVADSYVAAVGIVTGAILDRKISMSTYNEDLLDWESKADPRSPNAKEFGVSGSTLMSSSSGNSKLREAGQSNTESMIAFAKAIVQEAHLVTQPVLNTPTEIRVGVHTGSCMSGIVGSQNLRYCLFGDTMNTAARMQQNGLPGCIHTTREVVGLAPEHSWAARHQIFVKGKGSMQTYLLRVTKDGTSDVGSE